MARNRFKIFTVFTVILLMLFAMPLSANAEVKTTDIFNIEEKSNMAVTLYYDVEEPAVSFTAPNGSTVSASSLKAERGDNAVCYYIPDAAAGQWQMTYDKKSNSTLDVNWAPYVNAINIDSFDFTELSAENSLEASFMVSSDTEGGYSYTIYGVVVDSNGSVSGRKELQSGNGTVGKETTVRINTSSLQPHDGYRLYLDVWRSEYGLEASDTAVSNSIFNVEGDVRDAIDNFYAEVNFTDGRLNIDWSEYSVSCDEYIIGVFDTANDSEPLYANSFDRSITQTSVLFDKSVENVRVELSYIQSNKTSATLKKEVPLKTGVEYTFPFDEVTSSKQISIEYSASQRISAHITVNTAEQDISIEGNGSFSINLDDFDNDVSISYSLNDDRVVYINTFRISVDTIAPILLLPENDVTLFVESDTFDLAGASEAGCTVTVNGEPVTLNSDGTFVHTLTLAYGENEFIVDARDKAGNAASQLIVINKVRAVSEIGGTGDPLWLKYLPLILSFLGSIAVIAAAFLLARRFRKDTSVSGIFAVISLIKNISLAVLIPAVLVTGYSVFKHFSLNGVINSEELFEIAGNSVSDAYDIIKQLSFFDGLLLIGIITTAALCVIFTASLLLSIFFKKRVMGGVNESAVDDAPCDTGTEPSPSGEPAAPVISEQSGETKPDVSEEAAPAEAPETEPVKMFCQNCGAPYTVPAKFCTNCGHKFD